LKLRFYFQEHFQGNHFDQGQRRVEVVMVVKNQQNQPMDQQSVEMKLVKKALRKVWKKAT